MELIKDLEHAIKQHQALYQDLNPRNVSRYVDFFDALPLDTRLLNSAQLAMPKYWNHPLIQEAILRIQHPIEMLNYHYYRGTSMLKEERYNWAEHDFGYCVLLLKKLADGKPQTTSKDQNVPNEFREIIANVLNNYGFTAIQHGRILQAMLLFTKALKFNPNMELAKYNLMGCYGLVGVSHLSVGNESGIIH